MIQVMSVIFLINNLFYKMSENSQNVHHNFPELKVTSSNGLFCPTNSPKSKDIQLRDIKSPHIGEPDNVFASLRAND